VTVELRKLKHIEIEITELKKSLANQSPESLRRLLEVRRSHMLSTIERTSIEVRIARQEAAHILLEAVRRHRFSLKTLFTAIIALAICTIVALLAKTFMVGAVMLVVGTAMIGIPFAVKNVAQARLNREARRRSATLPELGTVVL